MRHSRSQGYAGPCGLRVSQPYTSLGKGLASQQGSLLAKAPALSCGPREGDKVL